MRRLAPRLFTLCAAVSLLLSVATCVLWVRSHFVRDRWGADDGVVSRDVVSNAGRLTFVHVTMENNPVPRARIPFRWHRSAPHRGALRMQWAWDAFRFSWSTQRRVTNASNGPVRITTRELSTPYWPLVLLAGIAPAVWLRRTYRAHRLAVFARRRLCSHCGYDLRASPGRCPECGATAGIASGT